jgi:hypothetical protein
MVCLKIRDEESITRIKGGVSAEEDPENNLVVKDTNGFVVGRFRLDDVERLWIVADNRPWRILLPR